MDFRMIELEDTVVYGISMPESADVSKVLRILRIFILE